MTRGALFSEALGSEPLVDRLLVQVVAVGESSGALAPALSVTRTVKLNVPAVSGFPPRTPAVLSESPETEPAVMDQLVYGGVPPVAERPNQDPTSKPGTVSATVGRCGIKAKRRGVVTAIALSLPAFTCGRMFGTLSNVIGTRPPITSSAAGALPL